MKKGEAGGSGIQASFSYKENYLTAKTKTPPHTRRLYTLIPCMGFSCGDIVGNMLMSVRVRGDGDGVVVGSATQAVGGSLSVVSRCLPVMNCIKTVHK